MSLSRVVKSSCVRKLNVPHKILCYSDAIGHEETKLSTMISSVGFLLPTRWLFVTSFELLSPLYPRYTETRRPRARRRLENKR